MSVCANCMINMVNFRTSGKFSYTFAQFSYTFIANLIYFTTQYVFCAIFIFMAFSRWCKLSKNNDLCVAAVFVFCGKYSGFMLLCFMFELLLNYFVKFNALFLL